MATGFRLYARKGNELPQNATAVILKDQLREFIVKQYPQLPAEIQDAVADFCNNVGADVAYRNRDFHLKLTKE
jgi:type I restriction enzyme R subunit